MSKIDPFDLAVAISEHELIDAIVNRPKKININDRKPNIDNRQANVYFQEQNTEDYYQVIITVKIPRK